MRTALLAASLCLAACNAPAADTGVTDAWVRLPAAAGRPGAGYFTVTLPKADAITAVSSTAAERIEMHESMAHGGMMRMEPIARVDLAPGQPTVFAPEGKHLMLYGVDPALKPGGTIPLTFSFADAPSATVDARLVAPGATPDE